MSLDIRGTPPPSSPVVSGRSSPVNPRIRNRDDDVLAKKDRNYRRFASGVERVLALFDTAVEEWADYISFLGRLLKALQLKPAGTTDIPHKSLVAKRLSQCLNPTLPSGVHQKTLEVYAYIFATLGKDGLSIDLSLYLSGFAPLLSFAALSVKPGVLGIFETYILQLKPESLRPALKAIILALLPGLEEESSDEFERTSRILASLKNIMGNGSRKSAPIGDSSKDHYFWQCMFLASITSRSRRIGALAYLTKNLPRLVSPASLKSAGSDDSEQNVEDEVERLRSSVEAIASPEPGLLIRCFCAGLRDEQLLTQRGFLDILVTHLPLHSIVLREKATSDDLERLVAAASSVVARRDMSLNRRLWSWFLGPEPTPDGMLNIDNALASPGTDGAMTPHHSALFQTRYFEKYGLEPLVRGIRGMIESTSQNPSDRARPLRICLSLMDRWEIGGIVLPQVFLPAMQSVWRYQALPTSKEAKAEVLRSANMFFDGVESGLIWAEMSGVVNRALSYQNTSPSDSCEMLNLVLYVITTFNIREEEMQVVHIPLVSLTLLLRVQSFLALSQTEAREKHAEVVLLSLRIANKLLDLVPQRAFASDPQSKAKEEDSEDVHTQPQEELVATIAKFYTNSHGNLDVEQPPFTPQALGRVYLQSAFSLVALMLVVNSTTSHAELEAAIGILNSSIRKIPYSNALDLKTFWSSLMGGPLGLPLSRQVQLSFPVIATKILALETIYSASKSTIWIPKRLIRQLIPSLISGLWPSLSPSKPKHNVEAVRCLWRLHMISPDKDLAESALTTLMLAMKPGDNESSLNVESARRFATLWTHSPLTATGAHTRRPSLGKIRNEIHVDLKSKSDLSLLERPLLLLLDALGDPKSALFIFVVNWLRSLPSLAPITNMLINKLSTIPFVAKMLSSINDVNAKATQFNAEIDDLNLCLYYLQSIGQIIEYSTTNVWAALAAPSTFSGENEDSSMSDQRFLTAICLKLLRMRQTQDNLESEPHDRLNQTAVSLIQQLLRGPSLGSILEMGIELPLLDELIWSVDHAESALQISLLEVVFAALRVRAIVKEPPQSPKHQKTSSRELVKGAPSLSISTDGTDRKSQAMAMPPLPTKLLYCLTLGLTSRNSRPVLESWIAFLDHCLPLYADSIFQILIPLVECFCKTLESVFKSIQENFGSPDIEVGDLFEPTLGLLLNGLEQSLATAHDRLMQEEVGSTPIKTAEPPPQGFFGNMVGVFTAETTRSKSATANSRLTVLLCFKDAIQICFTIWSWGDFGADTPLRDTSALASFNYTTLRLRNRTRRIFEHLFAAEALECLETLIEIWQSSTSTDRNSGSATIFNLLHVIESSRPKNAMPAIFNAMYSRTNPGALDPARKSTLTSNLTDTCLVSFLVAYTRSLDDDAMDEIWNDCLTFLKDVLANPMPHRQTLARLLEFTSVLGEKVDNTNFGEQRKMRRELGDLFIRLLTATLTIRPMVFSEMSPSNLEKPIAETNGSRALANLAQAGPEELVSVLAAITPNLSKVLIDPDRIASTTAVISAQVLVPTFRSKLFPKNVNQRTLELMIALGGVPEASKSWKKDVSEAFNDPKFFGSPASLVHHGWLSILRQWILADKERMPELFSRLTTPTSAGIMFGVGAASARLDADRKTQLNLRRIAFLIMASANDMFVVNFVALQEKLIDLMSATASSSPSSITRAEIYMVMRALVMKTSATHLSSFWPAINSELYDALSSAFPDKSGATYNTSCLLQASKLLETLLILGLEDFQMQEWLFITDTTDALYPPTSLESVALVDELAEGLDSGTDTRSSHSVLPSTSPGEGRKPLLRAGVIKDVPKDEVMDKVLRPFFRQLSIHTFESTYGMDPVDWESCFDDLMMDLFDDSTLV